MQSTFLSTNPLNFNIFQVALDTERAIWQHRQSAGLDYSEKNFRIHEGDVKMIILSLEKNGLIVVPKDELMKLLEFYTKNQPK